MLSLSQSAALRWILTVAGLYVLLLAGIALARRLDFVDAITAAELMRGLTTVSSVSVGAILGFHLASRRHADRS